MREDKDIVWGRLRQMVKKIDAIGLFLSLYIDVICAVTDSYFLYVPRFIDH